jgi:hypothetical protein
MSRIDRKKERETKAKRFHFRFQSFFYHGRLCFPRALEEVKEEERGWFLLHLVTVVQVKRSMKNPVVPNGYFLSHFVHKITGTQSFIQLFI